MNYKYLGVKDDMQDEFHKHIEELKNLFENIMILGVEKTKKRFAIAINLDNIDFLNHNIVLFIKEMYTYYNSQSSCLYVSRKHIDYIDYDKILSVGNSIVFYDKYTNVPLILVAVCEIDDESYKDLEYTIDTIQALLDSGISEIVYRSFY